MRLGVEPLLLAVAVLRDDRRRRVEDDLRRAVVALEADGLRFREVVLEIEDVLQVGAAPLVDRLIGVADDAEVAVRGGEPLDQQVLRPVGVLVLVHHQVAELLAVPTSRTCSDFSNSSTVLSSRSSKSSALASFSACTYIS